MRSVLEPGACGRSFGQRDRPPGPGDGIIDDCVGKIEKLPAGEGEGSFKSNIFLHQQPDGYPDLYIQNPLWGNVYNIGNFNQHDYEAFVFELIRRQYRSWELQGYKEQDALAGN